MKKIYIKAICLMLVMTSMPVSAYKISVPMSYRKHIQNFLLITM